MHLLPRKPRSDSATLFLPESLQAGCPDSIRLTSVPQENPLAPLILLVDDDEDIRYITELFLTLGGYRVIPCAAAHLAADAFRSTPLIDLLLTDMQMPGTSGLELARELTSLRPSLPVLIVSGRPPTPAAQAEMQDRHWHFLSKASDSNTLLSRVGDMVRAASPSL